MRVIFAFLLGVAVTVGVAFVRDATTPSSAQPFVNWEVVSASTRGAVDSVASETGVSQDWADVAVEADGFGDISATGFS